MPQRMQCVGFPMLSRIEFRREQLGTPLPFDDASIDVVVSHNLLDAATALSADLILQPVGACRAL
ncbi:MAG TPA: hypothetical protein VK922_03280 [Gemmatimonadaceae bacterium]|nr:hypothetical protein [Gemmatimonadaceae bacterium]